MILKEPHLSYQPKKIISLVPSITELLSSLNLHEEVIGITKFCVHPRGWFENKKKIGGTKNLNLPALRELQPDLIIANIEENKRSQVEDLMGDFNIWVTDVASLENAYQMITDIGQLTGKDNEASKLVSSIRNGFDNLSPMKTPVPAAYFIWKDPYMVAGGDTFISDMMKRCGFQNFFSNKNRYPEVPIDHLIDQTHGINKIEVILLSSEPYPFNKKHLAEFQKLLPEVKILLVDGEMFSWYGSRLLEAPAYFKKLIHL
jgi:ABC-type Fe3+-hydroxamate transport system substrate-binding protein